MRGGVDHFKCSGCDWILRMDSNGLLAKLKLKRSARSVFASNLNRTTSVAAAASTRGLPTSGDNVNVLHGPDPVHERSTAITIIVTTAPSADLAAMHFAGCGDRSAPQTSPSLEDEPWNPPVFRFGILIVGLDPHYSEEKLHFQSRTFSYWIQECCHQ